MGALVHVGDEAQLRLEQLGLQAEWIERALVRGDAEARTVSQLAPKGFEGTVRWGRSSEFLREDLCGRSWTPDDTLNIARSVSPDGKNCLVVTTGARGTGVHGPDPTTKYTKGSGTAAAIETNLMLDFLPEDLSKLGISAKPAPDMLTWFLLFYLVDDVIYAEVSLPEEISTEGTITLWRERIIIDAIQLNPGGIDEGESGPTDPVDVPVVRR